MALQILVDCVNDGIDVRKKHVQNIVCNLLHDELFKLSHDQICLVDLVVTRRVSKTIDQFTVSTLTQSALLRANSLGHDIPPGRKVRFVVVRRVTTNPADRVVLLEELDNSRNLRIDFSYYRDLAIRAMWAILAPFGWSDDEIIAGSKTLTLFDFQPNP
jgi:DNA polymerase elongation subunit (family B)